MRNFLLVFGLFFCGFTFAFGQEPLPTPQPTPVVNRPNRPNQSRELMVPPTNQVNAPDGMALRQIILQSSVQPLYRNPTREELKAIAPDWNLQKKFEEFLRADNTGLIKLLADTGCAGNAGVVVAKEDCLKYTMPGAGNSYSFRINNYRVRHLADLTFSGNSFYVTGVLMHGIMVNLGDVPLETVTLQTNGLKFLTEFQPTGDFEEAKAIDQQLIKGISKDGFLYSRKLDCTENTTYVLRSIAYDGKIMRSVKGIAYNELDFDKRKDVTIVFRVVRRDYEGNLTILWKELLRKNAPKFKKKLNERDLKIKENKFVSNNNDD